MNIEDINIKVKPRNPWKAIDLGFMMGRHWFLPLALVWLIVALPVFIICHLVFQEQLFWAAFTFWWCKPLYEKLPLYFLSRRLFNDTPSRQDWKHNGWRVATQQLFSSLTYRRFSPARSFNLPVSLLEQQKGRAYSERLHMLHFGQNGAGFFLTLSLFCFELILTLSFTLLIIYLTPNEIINLSLEDFFFGKSNNVMILGNALYGLAAAFFAPFYVAGGFSLYLARRTSLEAWDIELSFKRMTQRLAKGLKHLSIAGLCGLSFLLMSHTEPAHAEAVSSEPQTTEQEQVNETIEAILASDAFGTIETRYKWKPVKKPKNEEDETEGSSDWGDAIVSFLEKLFSNTWIANMPNAIATLLQWFIYLVFLVLIIWLLIRFTNWLDWLQPKRLLNTRKPKSATTSIMGMDIHADSLPSDVFSSAMSLIAQGDHRSALALLYRATLIKLVHEYHVDIPESATEQECLRLVKQTRPTKDTVWLSNLTRQWLLSAYAHETITQTTMEQLAQQWKEWEHTEAES